MLLNYRSIGFDQMKKSKNVECKPSTPSVIARLMGLHELQPQELVKKPKQQRVLSENYRRKVASIGIWEKKSGDEHRSFRLSIEEQEFIRESGPSLNESFAGAEFITVGASTFERSSFWTTWVTVCGF